MTKQNVKLLEKVKKHILAEPAGLNMAGWLTTDPKNDFFLGLSHINKTCGTVGCIAGWAWTLATPKQRKKTGVSSPIFAELLLGIDVRQENELFYVSHWPYPFQSRICQLTPGTQEYAQVVADRIDAFIAQYCPKD